jgi:acetylornithine/succinyldiaminopimelate/putrescine aminotransferase
MVHLLPVSSRDGLALEHQVSRVLPERIEFWPLNRDAVGGIIMGMLNRGMLMVPCGRYGNVFRFIPPLILTRQHAEKAVENLAKGKPGTA